LRPIVIDLNMPGTVYEQSTSIRELGVVLAETSARENVADAFQRCC
jgi:hypothetical protein